MITMIRALSIAIFGLGALTPTVANALLEHFLVIETSPGVFIQGDSEDSEYAGNIGVLAWSWGGSNPPGAQTPIVEPLSVTIYNGSASAELAMAVLVRTSAPYVRAKLIVRDPGGEAAYENLVIEMKGVRVDTVSIGGSKGELRLTENVTLSFDEACFTQVTRIDSGLTPARTRCFDQFGRAFDPAGPE